MAIERGGSPIITSAGLVVASPNAHHGTHVFRSATNFNVVVDALVSCIIDHAGDLGNIKYIKEWWEEPAIVGETDEFPCFYILPLHPDSTKVAKDAPYKSEPYIGDPLSMTTYPITLMGYYKYTNVRHPVRDVRNYAWNLWDILSTDKRTYCLPAGLQAMTPDVGWHIAGTNYVVQWWSMRLKMSAIL